MSDTTTPNLGLDKPAIGASRDTWGSKVNGDLDIIDANVSTTAPVMDGAAAVGTSVKWARADHAHPSDTSLLPVAGGTVTGNLTVNGNVIGAYLRSTGSIQADGALTTNGRSTADTFMAASGAFYVANNTNYYLARNAGNGAWTFVENGTTNATVDTAGGITARGTVESSNGRVISVRAGGWPSLVCYDTNMGQANGICLYQSGALHFGGFDGAGNFNSVWGYLSNTSIGWNAGTVSIACNNGANAMCYGTASDFNVPGNAWKPGGGQWTDSSDARIKTVLGDYSSGLEAILALRPVRYTFKANWSLPGERAAGVRESPHDGPATTGTEYIGLVAQDAEVLMPEMVTRVDAVVDGVTVTDLRMLDMTALPLALVNAVRELAERVAALEAR